MVDCILKSQNPANVAIDEASRTAQSSVQWLLEKRKDVAPITFGNTLDFLICGEEGFKSIANDLASAKSTVDIICWGFDPGMELVRQGGSWRRGTTYGELLEQLANRKKDPVTVRLLIWYDARGSAKQNNMPGYSDVNQSWSPVANHVRQAPPYNNPERHKYCVDWWARNLPGGNSGTGTNPHLHVVLRSISKEDVQRALQDEDDKPAYEVGNPVDETGLLENYPTHHQKPILIDYAYEDGKHAVGYVMGLNSVTDFWDTTAHRIDDPLRETWSPSNVATELQHEKDTQNPKGPLSTAAYQHTKPYQDYACRIVGPALQRLHQNFERGWNLFAPPKLQSKELPSLPSGIPTQAVDPAYQVQIVRTQPHEGEKFIKELYFQATSFARNYIYIENQYFFYPRFAIHLKESRKNFCDAWAKSSGKPIADLPPLHLFIVIPHPEDEGMVPRTYDMVAELGDATAMPDQGKLVDAGKVGQRYKDATGKEVLDRPTFKQLQDTIGLKVSIARLRTSGNVKDKMAYREVYIHSKLMLIDDVFVTLGSANLNQRSMAVDSEINIAATGNGWSSNLRNQIFSLHSGAATCGSGNRSEIAGVFEKWKGRMNDNLDQMMSGDPMNGFLLPFSDLRSTTTLHASVTVPKSPDTAVV